LSVIQVYLNKAKWILSRPYVPPVIFSLIIFFIYTPTFLHPFASRDALLGVFSYKNTQCHLYNMFLSTHCLQYPDSPQLIAIGRVLAALLIDYYYSFITSFSGLVHARLVSVILLIVAGLWLANHLKACKTPDWIALAISAIIITSRCCAGGVIDQSQIIIIIINLLLICAAYTYIRKGHDQLNQIKTAHHYKPSLILYGYASLFLLCSFYIYPATTFLILIFPLAQLLFSPLAHWKKNKARIHCFSSRARRHKWAVFYYTTLHHIAVRYLSRPIQ